MLPKSENITIFGATNNQKRSLGALFLTVRNSRKIQVKVKDEATGDARAVGQRRELSPTLSFYIHDGGGVVRL